MRKIFAVTVLVMAVALVGGADIGTLSVTDTVSATGWNVEMGVNVQTAGAAAPHTNDLAYFVGQIYYPATWTQATVTTTSYAYSWRGTDLDPFDVNLAVSLTAPVQTPGLWSAWWGVWGLSFTGAGLTTAVFTSSYEIPLNLPAPTYTPDPNAGGNPVPALSMPALFILGMILAGVGVLILRRS